MLDLTHYLPARRKTTSSGWISFNAVCCVHNGQTADRRTRGGLKISPEGWVYHCFNCRFSTSYTLGKPLSYRTRKLLQWLGVPPSEIEKINFESLKHRSIFGIIESRAVNKTQISFQDENLPEGAELVCEQHEVQWNYLRTRAVPEDFPILSVTDTKTHNWRSNVIIPFTWQNRLVGYTARLLDNRRPKYLTRSQPGYVFGVDSQNDDQNWVVVVEGCFDALSIGGCAVLHNDISDAQAELIKSLQKNIVYVPDRDVSGLETIDRALELGWWVSLPPWHDSIKDVNDAVIKYSKLGALYSILQNRDNNRIRLELKKRQLLKKYKS